MPPTNISREQRLDWEFAFTAPIQYEGQLWYPVNRDHGKSPTYLYQNGEDACTAEYMFPWFHLYTIQRKRIEAYRKRWHNDQPIWIHDPSTNRLIRNPDFDFSKKRPYRSFTTEGDPRPYFP